MMMKHYYKVTLRVKNEVGVLARVTTLLRKFQVNIKSLDVAPIDDAERFSDIHMVMETEKDKHDIQTVLKKTQRLIPVVETICEKEMREEVWRTARGIVSMEEKGQTVH